VRTLYRSPQGLFNYNNHNVTVPGILPEAEHGDLSHGQEANRFPKSDARCFCTARNLDSTSRMIHLVRCFRLKNPRREKYRSA